MNNWKNITANSNLVQHSTERAMLIKVPNSKMKFWHPSKLVRITGKNGHQISIGVTDDFVVKLFRNGEGNNFKKTIESREISGLQLIEMFGV